MIRTSAALLPALALVLASAADIAAQQTLNLPARDRLLTEPLVPQFSIGADEGEHWELLAGVRQVAFDRAENLYILDSNNQRVLVFDPSGRFVQQIGKKGEGPGELMVPLAMTVSADRSVIISDLGRRAYTIFKPDGTFVRNVTLGGEDFSAFSLPIFAHPAGIVSRVQPARAARLNVETQDLKALSRPTGPQKSPIVLTDLATGKQTSVWEVTLPSVTPRVDQQAQSGRASVRIMSAMPEFSPPVLFGVVPGGSVAVASEAAYRVRITANGKVQRILERPISPRKVGKREQDLARERRRADLSGGSSANRIAISMIAGGGQRPTVSTAAPPAMTPAQIEQQLETLQFMDQVPVLHRLTTDPAGRLWLQRTAADLGESGPVDILTHDGRYIGTIRHGRAPDAVSAGGRAAWVERDELGVERVVVRRVPESWR